MRKLRFLIIAVLLLSVSILGAQPPQATPAAQTAPAGTVKLTGKVLDSTGGVMVSVDVKVFPAAAGSTQIVKQGQTDGTGSFSLDVPPGQYRVEVAAVDFTTFKQTVQVAANTPPLAVTLTLAALADVVVEVNTQSAEIGVDPNSSLNAVAITGEALLDLPENEEDLATYLQNLAARMGGAEGAANVIIDGFTEGRLPPRDQIAEIRIVNNSFSAEGGGEGPRIEIITRTGTGRWRGSFSFNFADEALNASNAWTGRRPARQSRSYTTSANGPVIPNKLNMGFRFQSSESEGSAQTVRAITENGPFTDTLSSPTITKVFGIQNARYSLNSSNTLNFSGSMTNTDRLNSGVQGFNLPSRASDSKSRNWQVQMSDRAVLGTLVHELRFQGSRNNSINTPKSNAIAINVADSFNGGGGQNRSDNTSKNYQVANTLTWQLFRGKLNLRTGNQVDYRETSDFSESNYNGTYRFANLHDYCVAINFNGTNCVETKRLINEEGGVFKNAFGTPVSITGIPTQYTRTFGDPDINVSQLEFSTYVQGDWRLTTKAQLQTGLRYTAQQHLKDYNNFAPTLGLNYQVRNSPNWGSVVRVGGRVTQQSFSMGNYQQLLQSNGLSRQFNVVLDNPVFDAVNGPAIDESKATGTSNSIRVRADDYTVGYSINTSATWEQSLPKQMRVSLTYDRTKGVHNNRNRNINAPYPGTKLPDDILALLNSTNSNITTRNAERAQGRALVDMMRPFFPIVGNITQMEPTGNSLSHRVNLNFRTQNRNYFGGRVNFGGNISYGYSWGYNDSSPINLYDIAEDWGLSQRQHNINSSAQLNLFQNHRWKNLRLTLTPTWRSGSLYSITTGRDENGDSSQNDRPFGVGRNTEVGPSNFNMNLTASKTFYVGGGTPAAPRIANNYAEPQGGGGFGGGGGGGFGGGGGGGRGGGGTANQRGTQITLSATANNVLNRTQFGNYSGVLTSPYFGRSNTTSGERNIRLSLSINYQ